MKRRYFFIILLVCVQVGICLLIFLFLKSSKKQSTSLTSETIIQAINDIREYRGIQRLAPNAKLSQAALRRGEAIIKTQSFSHFIPKEKTAWEWIEEVGYQYSFAAENLGINYESVPDLVDAWMKSETHRNNIINQEAREIGVAILPIRDALGYKHLVVELIASPNAP